jgi:hypothetical protein
LHHWLDTVQSDTWQSNVALFVVERANHRIIGDDR